MNQTCRVPAEVKSEGGGVPNRRGLGLRGRRHPHGKKGGTSLGQGSSSVNSVWRWAMNDVTVGNLDNLLKDSGVVVPQGVGPRKRLRFFWVKDMRLDETGADFHEEPSAVIRVTGFVELTKMLND